jgi:putative pyruvate formate lyase activating enzyme
MNKPVTFARATVGSIAPLLLGAVAPVYAHGLHLMALIMGRRILFMGKEGPGRSSSPGVISDASTAKTTTSANQQWVEKSKVKQALAAIMLELQQAGCHNINFVSPSHVVAEILEALVIAAEGGLSIPLVYNTGGYDSPEALELLDGVIDIYMPDMKYSDRYIARRYSKIGNYPEVNRAAVKEMHRQVGDLVVDANGIAHDANGIAQRGLLVRHLILPHNLAGTSDIVRFLAEEVSVDTYLNLMDQYRPAYKIHGDPQLNRPLKAEEYQEALELARSAGLRRLDQRRSRLIIW